MGLKVRLGSKEVEPQESARFRGVWLGRKLTFAEHVRKVKGKLSTQNFALTGLAASTWAAASQGQGNMYKGIRSAVAYVPYSHL